MASPRKRIENDVVKLLTSAYQVTLVQDSMQEFFVRFPGPSDTPFEGGMFKVHVELPADYPYRSPSIGFVTTMFHPNIEERSGTICLDVINQSWTPMYTLQNVFEDFLPQLLSYPNAADPLNHEAANLYNSDPASYAAKVRDYTRRFASVDDDGGGADDEDDEDEDDEDEDDEDDEPAGNMEDI